MISFLLEYSGRPINCFAKDPKDMFDKFVFD